MDSSLVDLYGSYTIDEADVEFIDEEYTTVNNENMNAYNSNEDNDENFVLGIIWDIINYVMDLHFSKKVKKRKCQPQTWARNIAKKLKNSGQEHSSSTNKNNIIPAKTIRPACSTKCRLKCYAKFDITERESIFKCFWNLSDIDRQREYIVRFSEVIVPKYQYIRVHENKKERTEHITFY